MRSVGAVRRGSGGQEALGLCLQCQEVVDRLKCRSDLLCAVRGGVVYDQVRV